MGFKSSQIIGNLNNAIFPNNNTTSNEVLGSFGGESADFARGIEQLYAKSFYSERVQADGFTVAKGMNDAIPRSLANEYALFNYRGMYGDLIGSKPFSDYFDGGSKPNDLMGGENAKSPSVAKIIQFFDEVYPKIKYKPADFLYAKYYKNIPVNHLITLRRFPTPVNDNIFDLSIQPGNTSNETVSIPNKVDATQVAGVTAVTYLGETAGNKLEDILNFSFGLTWKEVKSEMEEINTGDQGYTSQPFYSKIGSIGRAVADTAKAVSSGTKFRRQLDPTTDRLGTTYANFVIGPVNVINSTTVRDTGIKFDNDIKLTFEYELKSLNYVNPKIAMLDIISNMLTMTTNNGQFFGGGHRYYGASGFVASQFGDPNKLRNGDFAGYIGSVVTDVETGFKNVFGNSDGGFDLKSILQGGLAAGKNLLGNMLGSFLNSEVGAVSGIGATKAFISGEPTGDWHLTVGNPFNPIVMMGNMYVDSASMVMGKGLGYDDFPMEVKFEIDLKHGKPRDKGDIENMFNEGRGRIYASAADENDILNLKGLNVATYGSIQPPGAKINLQNTQSNNGTPASSLNKTSNVDKTGVKQSNTAVSGEYVSNLVSLMIDS